MPYIKQKNREKYDNLIDKLYVKLLYAPPGDINYVISRLIWKLFNYNKNYENANKLLGVLTAVLNEFYRIKVAPYEDIKQVDNGQISD